MNILAIDTSCDETSVSVVNDDVILSNIIASQISYHKIYGGVVPSLAKRIHEDVIDNVINEALKKAKKNIKDIDLIAVTKGPGLALALETGLNRAKKLSIENNISVIGINHMIGHIYAVFAKNRNGKRIFNKDIEFPILSLLVSGGHTELVILKNYFEFEKIGETRDDAVGEAFDKSARVLGLGYPGGKILSDMAENYTKIIPLTIPMQYSKDFDFSYSGLKSDFQRKFNEYRLNNKVTSEDISNFSKSFELVAIEELLIKTLKAVDEFKPKSIIVGGGVSANRYLRSELRKRIRSKYTENPIPVYFPYTSHLSMDNAAMIGVVGYYLVEKKKITLPIFDYSEREPNLEL